MRKYSSVLVESDGGSRGNPGPAGYGAVLRDSGTGAVIAETRGSLGVTTNNVAEYRGLIAGLELYAEHAPDAALEVRMDSKLVIEQMAGRWRVKHPDLKPLAIRARRMAPAGTIWRWVPRERNIHADRLANEAMDAAAGGERANFPGDPTPRAQEPPAPGLRGLRRNPMLGWNALLGTPTTVVFLRHGQTAHTVERRFSGPGGDDPGLDESGRVQALRAAEALRRDGEVDAVVTSPLRRARETAEVVGESLGLPVKVDDGFRECAFGDWDGLTLAEVEQRWPDALDAWLASLEARPPGGESIAEVQVRVEASLLATLSAYEGHTVVVVSHVNPIKLAVRYCLGAPLDSVNRMQLAAGSLTTLSFYESGATSLRQFSALP